MKTVKKLLTLISRRRFPYQPLITVEISRSRLLNNLNEFRKLTLNGVVAPVLKSNAYGHGLLEVAEILESEKDKKPLIRDIENADSTTPHNPITLHPTPFFIVDSYFEAIALHSSGIKTPLLVIGYSRPEILLGPHPRGIILTVTNSEMLAGIAETKRPIRFHLKIDTGMHRQGVTMDQLNEAISIIRNNPNLIIEGVCSHLPDGNNPDSSFTETQIALWNSVAAKFKNMFPSILYVHLSATDGHRFSKKIEANLTRLGIGLYGLSENEALTDIANLEPVLEMKTIITGVKNINAGETVGYNNAYKAQRKMTVATVPVGYFEGIDRRLSSANGCEP